MLLSHVSPSVLVTELDSIHNYYERQVFEMLQKKLPERYGSNNYIADIACVALNLLPPRYVRHDIDVAYYLSPAEHLEMEAKVEEVVDRAVQIVEKGEGQSDDE